MSVVSIRLTPTSYSLSATLTGSIVLQSVNAWYLYKNGVLSEQKSDNTSSVTFGISETANYYIVANYTYNQTTEETRYRRVSEGSGSATYYEGYTYVLYSQWAVDSITGNINRGSEVYVLGEDLYRYVGYYTYEGKRIDRVPSYSTYYYTDYGVEEYTVHVVTPITEQVQSATVRIEYAQVGSKCSLFVNGQWHNATAYIYHNDTWIPSNPLIYSSNGWR